MVYVYFKTFQNSLSKIIVNYTPLHTHTHKMRCYVWVLCFYFHVSKCKWVSGGQKHFNPVLSTVVSPLRNLTFYYYYYYYCNALVYFRRLLSLRHKQLAFPSCLASRQNSAVTCLGMCVDRRWAVRRSECKSRLPCTMLFESQPSVLWSC